MATSGTYTFQLEIADAIDEAIERIGGEPSPGSEAKNSLRTLNLLFTDWNNRGVMLYELEQVDVTTTSSVITYTMSSTTEDVVYAVYRTSTSTGFLDYNLTRLGYGEYAAIVNKTQSGRPTQFFLDRQRDAPVVYLYPVPTSATLGYFRPWRIRQMEDAGGLSNTPDAPRRMWPALVSGLAYYLGQKRLMGKEGDLARLAYLKGEYEADLQKGMEADRERTSLLLRPRFMSRR